MSFPGGEGGGIAIRTIISGTRDVLSVQWRYQPIGRLMGITLRPVGISYDNAFRINLTHPI